MKLPSPLELVEALDQEIPKQVGARVTLSQNVLAQVIEEARPPQFLVDCLILRGHPWTEPGQDFRRFLQEKGLQLVEHVDPSRDPRVIRVSL